jgi:aconitate hydratase 2/2-methylisocitrate dehydratase
MAPEVYRYMNFDKMPEFVESAKRGQEVVLKLAM